ncbi:MAG TPA: low temperature requirement protein A [Acidothermaceae bacterium]|nr:low temperature requirement protein A [Acidothermaceae bacterium]
MSNHELLHRLRRDLWQPPRQHGEIDRQRTVGPLELFYDLVVVVLVAQDAHRLASNLTWRGVGDFVTIFGVVWIVWFNGTLMHELHGREDIRSRISFLGQIALMVPLGGFIQDASGTNGRPFAITAALLLVLIAFLWWRIGRADTDDVYRGPTRRYILATTVYAALLASSAALGGEARVAAWAIASVLYLLGVAASFTAMRGEFTQTVAITDSLIERFGLLIIIVLGETVTGVVSGLSGDPANAHRIAVGVICVVIGFGSWWTYFDFIGHRYPRNTLGGTGTWLIAHLPVSAAIAAMGATMPALITHAKDRRAPVAATWIMCSGVAAVLVFMIALMASLDAWANSGRLLRSLAVANVASAAVAIALAVVRPAPLVLVILLNLTFAGPWTFAVIRRAILTPTEPNLTAQEKDFAK